MDTPEIIFSKLEKSKQDPTYENSIKFRWDLYKLCSKIYTPLQDYITVIQHPQHPRRWNIVAYYGLRPEPTIQAIANCEQTIIPYSEPEQLKVQIFDDYALYHNASPDIRNQNLKQIKEFFNQSLDINTLTDWIMHSSLKSGGNDSLDIKSLLNSQTKSIVELVLAQLICELSYDQHPSAPILPELPVHFLLSKCADLHPCFDIIIDAPINQDPDNQKYNLDLNTLIPLLESNYLELTGLSAKNINTIANNAIREVEISEKSILDQLIVQFLTEIKRLAQNQNDISIYQQRSHELENKIQNLKQELTNLEGQYNQCIRQTNPKNIPSRIQSRLAEYDKIKRFSDSKQNEAGTILNQIQAKKAEIEKLEKLILNLNPKSSSKSIRKN